MMTLTVHKQNKYYAFTLAEILISLTILGILAVIVIPSLFQNTQEIHNKILLKNTISEFSSAHSRLVTTNGGSLQGLYGTYENSHQYLTALSQHITLTRICQAGLAETGTPSPHETELSKCIPRKTYKNLNPTKTTIPLNPWNDNDFAAAVLPSGAVIFFMQTGSSGALAWVDVNGAKPPNRGGYDLFEFGVDYRNSLYFYNNACDRTSNIYTAYEGLRCTEYVLKNQAY